VMGSGLHREVTRWMTCTATLAPQARPKQSDKAGWQRWSLVPTPFFAPSDLPCVLSPANPRTEWVSSHVLHLCSPKGPWQHQQDLWQDAANQVTLMVVICPLLLYLPKIKGYQAEHLLRISSYHTKSIGHFFNRKLRNLKLQLLFAALSGISGQFPLGVLKY
jgi:hypothetical protein